MIFDWGGVLMRTVDHSYRHQWDARLGLSPGGVEEVVHGTAEWIDVQLGKISVTTYWQAVRTRLDLSARDLDTLRNDFYRGDRLDLSLLNLIHDLRSQHVKVGLLSNNSEELDNDLRRLSGTLYFDAIAISYKLGIMKPSAESYHSILRMLEVAPQATVFIDDSPQNIQGALDIGLQALHFLPGIDIRSMLSSMFPQLSL